MAMEYDGVKLWFPIDDEHSAPGRYIAGSDPATGIVNIFDERHGYTVEQISNIKPMHMLSKIEESEVQRVREILGLLAIDTFFTGGSRDVLVSAAIGIAQNVILRERDVTVPLYRPENVPRPEHAPGTITFEIPGEFFHTYKPRDIMETKTLIAEYLLKVDGQKFAAVDDNDGVVRLIPYQIMRDCVTTYYL